MTAEWLIQWWNLIFIVPFAVAMLYLGLFVVSGLTFGDGDADADVSPDADMDADADISAEADVGADSDADADADVTTDADADADADHDVEAQADSAIPIYMTALAWLGLGRVPLSILLMALLMGWGLIGFATNFLLWPEVHRTAAEPILPILSMVLAGFGTLLFSATLARLMGRFLPLSETYAHRRHELLGLVGEAMFPIDREFGMAFIRAEQGEVFQAPCRIFSDGQPIEKGAKVRLVAYNARQQVFYVKLAEAEAKQGA